jgi:hypothetical protein
MSPLEFLAFAAVLVLIVALAIRDDRRHRRTR